MKRHFFTVLIVVLSLHLTISGQQITFVDQVRHDGVVRVHDLQPAARTLHPAASRAMARGEKPGTFKNVRYELAPNVRMLTPSQKSRIRLQQNDILEQRLPARFFGFGAG